MNRRDVPRGARRRAAAPSPARAAGRAPRRSRRRRRLPARRRHRRRRHRSSATTAARYGGKLLPETLGSGCAFLDYDADGWQDILLVNGMDWPGHKRQRSTLRLYRNNRNGTFTDVTRSAGLDVEMYGMGVAVGDFNNDGFPDLLDHLRRPEPAVPQHRQGHVRRRHATRAASAAARRSAPRRCGSTSTATACSICSSATTSSGRPEHDVFCSLDGKQKSYCTPEAYRGDTCWLFRNRGNGTFEDVTATSGIFDTSSKSLGVAMLDYDQDGWPDLFVANDTQPNKLYRNQRNGTFKDVARRGRRRVQRRRQGARRHGRRRRRLRQLRARRAWRSPTSTTR